MIQGSPEWIAARLGKVTSAGVAAVVTKGRNGGVPVTRNSYMDDLIAERITGRPADRIFMNDAVSWGSEHEDAARSLYAFKFDVDIEQVGFIDHPTIPMAGASPDGLVSDDGFVELKCPMTTTHVETLRRGAIPSKYLPQITWQAACMPSRRWVDFVSYDPRVEPERQLFVTRMGIDRVEVARLEDAVREFLNELAILEERVRAFVRRAA